MSRRTTTVLVGTVLIFLGVLVALSAMFGSSEDLTSISKFSPTPSGPCEPTTTIDSGNDLGANFPLRTALPGSNGAVIVSGKVTDTACTPQAGVLVRFWAASTSGAYTPESYGAVRSAADGSYRFETPFPGAYPDANPHVHVHAQIDGVAVRTEVHPTRGTSEYHLDLIPPSSSAPSSTEPLLPGSGSGLLP